MSGANYIQLETVMKKYVLKVMYNPKTEEVESISEYIEEDELSFEIGNDVIEISKEKGILTKINDIISSIQNAGINVGGNYIFGLPIDTKESMQDTLDFSLQNKTEMVNYYCAMAYPGSPLHISAKGNGLPLPKDYVGYSQHSYETLNLPTDTLSSSEILKFRDEAWQTYNTDEGYLALLENKFGSKARLDMEETAKINLPRKLLMNG